MGRKKIICTLLLFYSSFARADCHEYRKTNYSLDLRSKVVRKLGQSSKSHVICGTAATLDSDNLILEVRRQRDGVVLFKKQAFASLANYYDFKKNGKLAGGAAPAEEVLINTLMPTDIDESESAELVVIDFDSRQILGRGSF